MTKWFAHWIKLGLVLAGVGLIFVTAAALASPVDAAKSPPQPVTQIVAQDKPANDYCLSCHGLSSLRKTLPSGETLSLYIDANSFDHGIHNQQNIACVDCHKNISTFPHPDFKANTIRDVSLQLYVSCKDCHADEYNKTLNSIHQKARDAGNLNAAICTDCHNPHQQTRLIDPQT